MSFRASALASLAFGATITPWHHTMAQTTARIRGVVIDSAANRPLGDVRVQVRGTQWAARTDANGRFSVPAPGGRVVIVAQRLGYQPAEVTVEPDAVARGDSVVIRIRERPAPVSGVLVEAPAAPPMAQTITTATVRQLPPLLEPDIFRAIAFVPGVLQPSDLRGRMHIAGGRSDETGIRVNGHPLHNPFHLAELLSGFSVAAVERVDVLMHHVPAEYADHLSGVVDIATRRPTARSANEATVSLVSSSLTTAQPNLPGGVSLLASGRVTYLDKFLRLRYSEDWLRDEGVPLYGFVDGVVAAERAWDNGVRLQLTGFRTRDEIDLAGERPDGFRPYGWGEWLIGGTLGRVTGSRGWDVRVSLGRGSASYDSGFEPPPPDVPPPDFEHRAQLGTSHERLSAGARLAWQRERWAATTGLTFDRWRAEQSWRGTNFIASEDAPFRFAGSEVLNAASALATVVLAPRGRVSAGAHARLWLGNGRSWPAPGIWATARVSPSVTAQLALERRFQFESELAEPVLGIGRAPVFLLSAPREARVAGLQVAWMSVPRRQRGDSTAPQHSLMDAGPLQLRAQAFFKQYTRSTRLPERAIRSTYGPVDTVAPPGFPNFVRDAGRSYGLMIGGRVQPHRRLFVEGGYTYQRALEEFDGVLSPTAWDAPHQTSGFASVLLSRKWTLNLAGQARSGLPQTGVARRLIVPALPFGVSQVYVPGPRNGVQLPAYYRLDAGVRRTSSEGRVAWTFSFQLLNLLFKRNATSYDWFAYFCKADPDCGRFAPEPIESFSLPIIPSFGFEFRW